MTSPTEGSARVADVRVRIFVDFWNFQLGIRDNFGNDFRLDWKALGPWLTQEAAKLIIGTGEHVAVRYEGLHVYLSYNPKKGSADAKLVQWATTVLDRFPRVQVTAMERK